MVIRFARSARRHRIGRASAWHVINNTEPVPVHSDAYDDTLVWTGPDERDRELEIIGVIKPDCTLIVHVFPTALRSQS